MSSLLPSNFDQAHYWRTIYAQPVPDWLPALEVIRARHHLPSGAWERFPLGRNVVFACGPVVVKLSPPFWIHEIPREVDALNFVQKRLPVATPALLATGELATWRYLVQTRLPGELLRTHWSSLEHHEKIALAQQHGAVMAAVHALPVPQAPASLAYDWSMLLAEQWIECVPAMRKSGVPAPLLAGVEAYLEQARPLLAADHDQVLLHGDLDAINLLIERHNNHWRISGLVDWGDVKVGPRAHEFISPRIHMYRAEQATILPWYAGYGMTAKQPTPQFVHNVMARTMLYYADEFARILNAVPGVSDCQDWSDVAARFWWKPA
jgi:hygromycin-B 7''-O-kinase